MIFGAGGFFLPAVNFQSGATSGNHLLRGTLRPNCCKVKTLRKVFWTIMTHNEFFIAQGNLLFLPESNQKGMQIGTRRETNFQPV